MTQTPELIGHWYEALHSPIGIVLSEVNGNLESLKMKLYAVRKAAADPDLDALSIILSPTNPQELWIVRREPNAPQE